jgi:O-Antigen ligase
VNSALTDRAAPPRLVTVPLAVSIALLPFLRPAAPGNISPVDVPMLLSIVTALMWFAWSGARLRAPYAVAMAVFILAGTIGGAAGQYPVEGLINVAQDAYLLLWAVVVFNLMRSPAVMRLVLRTWVYSGIVWAAVLIAAVFGGVTAVSGIQPKYGVRAALTFGDPNYCANYFVIVVVLMWAARIPRTGWLRCVATVVPLVAMALTGSNGAVLSLAIAVGFAILVSVSRKHGAPAAVAVLTSTVLVAGLFVIALPPSQIETMAQQSGQPLLRDWFGRSTSSAHDRALILQESYDLYVTGMPFGNGPGTTKLLLLDNVAPFTHQAHDDLLAALVERGFLGLGAVLLLAASVTYRAWLVVKGNLSRDFATVVSGVPLLIGLLIAFAAASTYYEILHFRQLWAILALVAALQVWGAAASHEEAACTRLAA